MRIFAEESCLFSECYGAYPLSQHRRSLRPTAYSAAPTLAELGAAQVGPLTAFHRAEAELLRSRISFFLSYGSDAPPQMLKAAAQLMPLDPARARETYLEALIAALLTRRAGHQGGATLSSGHNGEAG